jgi:hypothetical protein
VSKLVRKNTPRPSICLRPVHDAFFNVPGPRQDASQYAAVAAFITISSRGLAIFGDGEQSATSLMSRHRQLNLPVAERLRAS